jgi:hypothetical protein
MGLETINPAQQKEGSLARVSLHSNPVSNGAHLPHCPTLWSAGPCEIISSKTSLRAISQLIPGSLEDLGKGENLC